MIEKSKVRLYNCKEVVSCRILGSKILFEGTFKEVRKVLLKYRDPISDYDKNAVYPKSRVILSDIDQKIWGNEVSKCVL